MVGTSLAVTRSGHPKVPEPGDSNQSYVSGALSCSWLVWLLLGQDILRSQSLVTAAGHIIAFSSKIIVYLYNVT